MINLNTSDQVHNLIYASPSVGNKVSIFQSLYLKKLKSNIELASKNFLEENMLYYTQM